MSNVASTISLASLGLGSGLNDASIISQLVAIQQTPLTQMQSQVTNIQSASTTISSFSSDLSALQSAANALSDPAQYASYTGTSSSSAVVASASSTATPGTYSVSVRQLAQAQINYGTTEASSSAALGLSGTLGITMGGQSYSVAVGAGDSLATIAANISSSGANLAASVVFDGTNYRLQVQALASGASNAVTFDENGFTLGLSGTPYQAAQDAAATVNGISVTSASNQITGAIPGVTLAVTGQTTSPATVTVASNPSAIVQSVASFVSAYNAVVSAGHAAVGYGATAASNTLLTGDQAIGGALDQLSGLIAGNVPGSDSTYQNLASVGVTLNNDGSLSLSQSQLTSAIEADPTGVEKLFVTSTAMGATGIMGTMSSAIDAIANNTGSPLKAEIQADANQVTSLQSQETALQARLTQYQTQLESEFTAMEQTVETEKNLYSAEGGTGTFV
jgi:flagellar hook-associated protein 2